MVKLNVQLMWDGVWNVINGLHEYLPAPQKDMKVRTLALRDDQTTTLDALKERVACRMGLDMDEAPYIDLFHMRPGLKEFPAAKIADDDEVTFLFETYEPRDTVRMFAEYDAGGSSGFCGSSVNHSTQKMVPRRNNAMVLATVDSHPGSLPTWDSGFNETLVRVGNDNSYVFGLAGRSEVRGFRPFDDDNDDDPHADPHGPSSSDDDDEDGGNAHGPFSFDGDGGNVDNEPGNNEPANNEPANNEPGNNEPENNEPGNNEPGTGGSHNNEHANTFAWAAGLQHNPTMDLAVGAVAVSSRTDGSTLEKGYMFETADELKYLLLPAATANGWSWGTPKQGRTRVNLKCRDSRCNWKVGAYKKPEERFYVVSRYNNIHTCSSAVTNFKHANVHVNEVAHVMLDQYRNGQKRPTIKSIKFFVEEALKTKISSWVAYQSRFRALYIIHGNRALQYQQLPSFFHMLELRNPGSYTKIERDADHRFKYCFMAIKAQLDGIPYMRPIVVIDAAFMKNEPLQIVNATMVDSEDCCYPVAWGIIDKEDNQSWGWFLGQLKLFIADDSLLTFISDRHGAIKHAVAEVYPMSQHVFCWWHIKQNLISKYGRLVVTPEGETRKRWTKYFEHAAKASSPEECRNLLHTLEAEYPEKRGPTNNRKTIAEYLQGDDCPPEKWSKAFAFNTRFDILCSNHAESMNSVLRDARCHSPLSFFTFVLVHMSGWHNGKRVKAGTWNTKLTPKREEKMRENYRKATRLKVVEQAAMRYRVTGGESGDATVSFVERRWDCTCHKFQRDWQPCVHACACAPELRRKYPDLGREAGLPDSDGLVMYNYTSECYSTEYTRRAYAGEIDAVPDRCDWNFDDIPYHIRTMVTLPPVKEVRVGAPQTTRHPSVGEYGRRYATTRVHRCTSCGKTGHNAATCPDNAARLE